MAEPHAGNQLFRHLLVFPAGILKKLFPGIDVPENRLMFPS
jgi:hypothetical protein